MKHVRTIVLASAFALLTGTSAFAACAFKNEVPLKS
jgi:hypothetical protein